MLMGLRPLTSRPVALPLDPAACGGPRPLSIPSSSKFTTTPLFVRNTHIVKF